MILSSGIGPDGFELRTTSGVCVESPSGKKYVTCASHGFPLGLEDVYHPNAGGAIVGRVSKTFWDSDVSLILPSQGFQYSQEPFSSADYQSSPFSSFKHPFELCIGDLLHMDTPFNGHCEGIVVAVRMMRLPSDEPATPHRYVAETFDYIGNGSAQPLDGCCGGVVWTEEFEVIGQFRCLDVEDCTAYITSFEQLIDLGYKLRILRRTLHGLWLWGIKVDSRGSHFPSILGIIMYIIICSYRLKIEYTMADKCLLLAAPSSYYYLSQWEEESLLLSKKRRWEAIIQNCNVSHHESPIYEFKI